MHHLESQYLYTLKRNVQSTLQITAKTIMKTVLSASDHIDLHVEEGKTLLERTADD